MLKLITSVSIISSIVLADCNTLKQKNFKELCEETVKEKVSKKYVVEIMNKKEFFKDDKRTLKLIEPKEIKSHRKKEKKANKVLSKHIDKIVRNLKEYEEVYNLAEEKYNLNREIIASILMKETRLGTYEPKHSALQTLSTIYKNIKPTTKRNKWLHKLSKNNIKDLIKYCYDLKVPVKNCDFKSSYIGAIGYPQFMPSSFTYIVPYKKEYSFLDNIPDSIMSVANYLNKRGNFNKKFNFSEIENMEKLEEEWYDFAKKEKNASFSFSKEGKYSCYSCEKKELTNTRLIIKDIMKYNNSSNYAIGVLGLAWRSNQKIEEKKN